MLRGVRRKLGKAIHERGVPGTAVLAGRYLADRVRDLGPRRRRQFRVSSDFDRAHGIETGGRIPLGDLDVADEAWREGNRYEAAVPSEFRDLIEKVPGPL